MAEIYRTTQLRKHVFSTCIKDWMCFVGFQCNLSPVFFPLWQSRTHLGKFFAPVSGNSV